MSESNNLTYYQRNRDIILIKAKDYYKNNKERLREQAKEKYKNLNRYHIMSQEKKQKLKEYQKNI